MYKLTAGSRSISRCSNQTFSHDHEQSTDGTTFTFARTLGRANFIHGCLEGTEFYTDILFRSGYCTCGLFVNNVLERSDLRNPRALRASHHQHVHSDRMTLAIFRSRSDSAIDSVLALFPLPVTRMQNNGLYRSRVYQRRWQTSRINSIPFCV